MTLPVLYTINGAGATMWDGPPADVGRALGNQGEALYYHQPIGYPSAVFPMGGSIDAGVAELVNQINRHPGRFAICAFSEGAIIACRVLEIIRSGTLKDRESDLLAGAMFGNPYREAGNWAPRSGAGAVGDPGGEGIGGPGNNTKATPSYWHSYAHPGDMYTCCPVGPVGDDMRIVFNFVLEKWSGAVGSVLTEALEWMSTPLQGGISAFMAAFKAIGFFGSGTREHVNYSPNPAINYLRSAALNPQTPAVPTSSTTTGGTMSIIKSIIAFLGSGFVVGIVAVLPAPYGPIVGSVVAAATGFLAWLVPNAPSTPKP